MGGRRLTQEEKLTIYREHRKGLSNREVAALLEDEDGNGPDQSTVARYVRKLPELPLDDPFQWNLLENSGAPWKASMWVLECQFVWEYFGGSELARSHAQIEEEQGMGAREVFTNRFANWCWRVHQADVSLEVREALKIARIYSYADQLGDLLPNEPRLDLRWLDAMLMFRPYISKSNYEIFRRAVESGQVASSTGLLEAMDRANEVAELTDVPISRVISNWLSVLLWLNLRLETFDDSDSKSEVK